MVYNSYMEDKVNHIREWLGTGSINIFGLPFAGKDTHGNILAEQLGAKLMGGGEILRNSSIPEKARLALDAGELIPSSDYIEIVLPYLSNKRWREQPLILSSVGRWEGEELGVIEAAKSSGHPIKAVIYLQIDPLEAFDRWEAGTKRNRDDDKRDILDTRFSEFMKKTLPVINTYQEMGLLIEVDGRPAVAEVTSDIINKLHDFAKQNP